MQQRLKPARGGGISPYPLVIKTSDGKNFNINQILDNRINKISENLEKAENSNGFIGKAWSGFKNLTGIGDSSDDVRGLIDTEKTLLKEFNANKKKRPEIFKQLTGVDYSPNNLLKFANGQIKLKSEVALNKYKEGQKMAVDITSDMVSGVVAYGIAAACVAGGIAAAPFTAGASLGAVAVGVGIAAGAGAATKVAVKAFDAYTGGREYTLKEASKDAVIGGVSGALAPITIGAGGAVASTTAKVAPKIIANTARYSVEGAMFGAVDGGTRAALEGESLKDVAIATGEGAIGGAIVGNVMGHGGSAIGKGTIKAIQFVRDNFKNNINSIKPNTKGSANLLTPKNITETQIKVENSDSKKLLIKAYHKATPEKPQLVDIEDFQIINNRPATILDPQNIEPSSLALVHMTQYEPQNGIILSQRDAITKGTAGASRNSVHFTLNHAVNAHGLGDWNYKNYAIIMPYESTVKSNAKGIFIEGMPNDLYTNGSVNIPEGAVIIKLNPEIEKGKFLISNYPNTNGVKLIESSEPPHKTVKLVLEKMGFSHFNTNNNDSGMFNVKASGSKAEFIENLTQNFNGWYNFCKTQNIKPMLHACSTNGTAELIIESIDQLAVNNRWSSNIWEHINYKKVFTKLLTDLEKNVSNGDFTSIDISKLKEIIQSSYTPRAALSKIENELNIIPSVNRTKNKNWLFNSKNDYISRLESIFGSPDFFERYYKFFSAPNSNKNILIDWNDDSLLKYKN